MKKATLIILATLVLSAVAAFIWRNQNAYLRTSYESPDGRYCVEVYSYPQPFGHMPGDSGGAPGYVRLVETHTGRVLRKKSVEMTMLIDAVRWKQHAVHIKLFADWNLPK